MSKNDEKSEKAESDLNSKETEKGRRRKQILKQGRKLKFKLGRSESKKSECNE